MHEKHRRCAIYTRRSFDPPVGQEITSLESQRRICASYIMSQGHRGWVEIATPYEDSGRSGANVVRPALQRMLADVESGLIDIVVVYKLDRLTRTLFDFVRLMDFLERHGAALVSITQNFDTSDSLGRLVLNVLLTFAQFEREILSDRMRDKIRVMKEMGRWCSGAPPLGYDVIRKKLVPNEREADAVRLIFQTYIETGSTEAAHRKVAGFRRKVWKAKTGNVFGGGPVTLSSIHHILRNPIYNGQVSHKGVVYPGIHQPLIATADFEKVQEIAARRNAPRPRVPENLLTGLLFDAAGRPMSIHAHDYKGRNFRYYASNVTAWARRRKLRRMRANGDELEQLVAASLRTLLLDRERLRQLLFAHGLHGQELDRLSRAGSARARQLLDARPSRANDILHGILERIEVNRSHVSLVIFIEELRRLLAWDGVGTFGVDAGARQRNGAVHILRVAASVVRAQKLFALPIEPLAADICRRPDVKLVSLLDDAQRAYSLMVTRRDLDLPALAMAFGCEMDRYSRLVRLTYLAPDIALAIRDGRSPPSLDRRTLMRANLPLDWATQRTLLGFPDQPDQFRNPNARRVDRNAPDEPLPPRLQCDAGVQH
jgi:site-specific DNA recombinase